MENKIEFLIIKFLTNDADHNELLQLETWIQNPENETLFFDYIRTNTLMNVTMSKYDKQNAKKKLLKRIQQDKNIFYRYKTGRVLKYAAAIVLFLALGYVYQQGYFTGKPDNNTTDAGPIIVNNNIKAGTDKAILTLKDGSEVTLEKGTAYQTQNANSNGEEIVYRRAGEAGKSGAEMAYNHITVPRGGQFHVKLSDGTGVWLNSESRLKYPVAFADGKPRQVELVYGEAYFDVSPSTDHKGASFKVFNRSQEVEVLGTEFNIKAYKDETNIYTTLVEGKVAVSTAGKNQILVPDQQSNLDMVNNSMSVVTVDVYKEISWKEGVFSFRNKPLKEIMKVLSRWYDMDVVFENKAIETEKFMGTLGRDQSIEDILNAIKSTNIINTYRINNQTIVLK